MEALALMAPGLVEVSVSLAAAPMIVFTHYNHLIILHWTWSFRSVLVVSSVCFLGAVFQFLGSYSPLWVVLASLRLCRFCWAHRPSVICCWCWFTITFIMFILQLLDCFGYFRLILKRASLVLVTHVYCKLSNPSSPRLQHLLLATSGCWTLIQVTGTCLSCCKWLRLILNSSHGQTCLSCVLLCFSTASQLLLPHYERTQLQLNRIMAVSCSGSILSSRLRSGEQELCTSSAWTLIRSHSVYFMKLMFLLDSCDFGVCVHVVECTDYKSLNKQNDM